MAEPLRSCAGLAIALSQASHIVTAGLFAPLVALWVALPRKLCAAASGTAGLGSAVWLNASVPLVGVSGGLTAAYALAVTAIAVLVILVTAAGTLLAADWRTNIESHRAWTETNVAAVELGRGAPAARQCRIDPVYSQAASNEALHRLLQAHRYVVSRPASEATPETRAAPSGAPTVGPVPGVPQAAAATSLNRGATSAALSEAAMSGGTPHKDAATEAQAPTIVAFLQRRARPLQAKPAACQMRLVANAWLEWPTRAGSTVARGAFDRPVANILVLCGDGDRARPLPEGAPLTRIAGSGEPPSCRDPPHGVAHRGQVAHRQAATPARLSVVESAPPLPTASMLPTADLVVRDNLGAEVRICAAELAVIQTYLDDVLRDILASSTADPQKEEA